MVSLVQGLPVVDGASTWVFSFHARGEDIRQAAKEGNVGAMRHFLRVDPESLERKDGHGHCLGLTLEATKQIHAFRKLGIFGKESVPLDRLGSRLCGTTKLLWRHLGPR